MEECSENDSCARHDHVLCEHRFTKPVILRHCNNGKEFFKISDLGIVLYFLDQLIKTTLLARLAPDHKVLIVTKDRKFLDAARREWDEVKHDHPDIIFNFNPRSVTELNSGIEITIVEIACKNYGTNAKADRQCAVERINRVLA